MTRKKPFDLFLLALVYISAAFTVFILFFIIGYIVFCFALKTASPIAKLLCNCEYPNSLLKKMSTRIQEQYIKG